MIPADLPEPDPAPLGDTIFGTTPAEIIAQNQTRSAVLIDQAVLAEESWADPTRGTVRFKTLLSGGLTPTDTMVCGIGIMSAGDTFALHSHPEAEVYFGIEGEADVVIDGSIHRLKPGVALFIPGGAVHGVPMADQNFRWFYTFARNAFSDIVYSFASDSAH